MNVLVVLNNELYKNFNLGFFLSNNYRDKSCSLSSLLCIHLIYEFKSCLVSGQLLQRLKKFILLQITLHIFLFIQDYCQVL